MSNIEEIWQQPDDIADIRRGHVIAVMSQGRRIAGIAHHVTDGAWFTAEGGLLVRPGQRFVWLERPAEHDALYTIIDATLAGERVRLIRTRDGWFDLGDTAAYKRIWHPGDAPLDVTDIEIIRPGLPL